MKTLLLRVVASLLLTLLFRTAWAQPTWQRLYGGAGPETCTRILALKAGGYLLLGARGDQDEANELFVIRTDERGRQLWARHHAVASSSFLTVESACENQIGQVLLTASVGRRQTNGDTFTTGLLALLQPDGSLAWSRRGEEQRSYMQMTYPGVAPDDQGNFWVAINETATSAALLRLDAAGKELQRIPFVLPTEPTSMQLPGTPGTPAIYGLFRLPTGLYVHVGSRTGGARLVHVSNTGVRGAATELPRLAYQSEGNTHINSLVPLDGDDALVVSSSQLAKIKLNSGIVYWTKPTVFYLGDAGRLPNGNLVLFGFNSISSHTFYPVVAMLDANGNPLLIEFNPQAGSSQLLRLGTNTSPSAAAGGIFVQPGTGQIVLGGYLRDWTNSGEAEIFLISAGSFAGLQAPVLEPLTGWPNPVAGQEQLTVPASFAQSGQFELFNLQGQLVRKWPEPVDEGTASLSMQGIPAGLYILTGRQANGARATLRVVKN